MIMPARWRTDGKGSLKRPINGGLGNIQVKETISSLLNPQYSACPLEGFSYIFNEGASAMLLGHLLGKFMHGGKNRCSFQKNVLTWGSPVLRFSCERKRFYQIKYI